MLHGDSDGDYKDTKLEALATEMKELHKLVDDLSEALKNHHAALINKNITNTGG